MVSSTYVCFLLKKLKRNDSQVVKHYNEGRLHSNKLQTREYLDQIGLNHWEFGISTVWMRHIYRVTAEIRIISRRINSSRQWEQFLMSHIILQNS